MADSALLASGDIAPGTLYVPFVSLITSEWRRYRLELDNVRPVYGADYNILFFHWSADNGITYDLTLGNYLFGKAFVTPSGSVVGTPKPVDQEWELAYQGADPSGYCGTLSFSDPLKNGVKKQARSFGSYFGPNNPCAEMAGYFYLPTAPVNAFRLCYYPPIEGGSAFGGGSYSLWGER